MTATAVHPKVFVSYSWSGVEHESFVVELATTLRTKGVDVILDKFRLKAGQDKYAFMESMVTDPEVVKVLILCDRRYKEKADSRSGGVGTETQIISSELYARVDQTKFIPVLCERGEDGEEFLPVFVKSRIYVDMSSSDKFGDGLDELLRLIFDQPLYPEPQLGEVPTHLTAQGKGMPTARELPAAVRAIREQKPSRDGLERLFLDSVFSQVAAQYCEPKPVSGLDEPIYQAIVATKGLRDQFVEYADTVAGFTAKDRTAVKPTLILLEKLAQKFGAPENVGTYAPAWADIYRFFALEVSLTMTAALIRCERWDLLARLTSYPVSVRSSISENKMCDITAFDSDLTSLDQHRNQRLNAGRVSVSADLLKERCSTAHTPFTELMQADAFLALYSVLHLADGRETVRRRLWWPRTTVYSSMSDTFPVFSKAVDGETKAGILQALSVRDSADLKSRLEAFHFAGHSIARRSASYFDDFDLFEATNCKVLAK